MNKLQQAAQILKNQGAATFELANVKTAVSKKKQTVMFLAKLNDGRVVEFNEKTMDRVVEPTDATETVYRVKPGTQFSEKEYPDGSTAFSLIPVDAASGSAFATAKF